MKVALRSLVEIKSGYSPSTFNLIKSGTIPYVKVEDLNNCAKYQNESREYCEDVSRSVPAGSIIFPKRGAAIMNNKVRIAATAICMDTNMMAIIPNGKTQSEFLYYAILYEKLSRIADTSTIPQINNKHISPYKILLPPLPEQKAIADLLSTWDEAIEKTERLIQAKERRFKWLLHSLVCGQCSLDNEKSYWKKVKLGEVCKVITSNVDKKTTPGEKLVRLCNYMDVYKNYYITSDLDFMVASATLNEIDKYQLKVNDVLLTKDSETPEDIANSACVLEASENLLCGYHLTILRPEKQLFGPYLNFVLHASRIRYAFSRQANGATRFGLSLSAYDMIEIPLPPIEKQRQIAETLSSAQQEIDLLKQLSVKYKTQKRGLMQKLLTGEWRVKPEVVYQYKEV